MCALFVSTPLLMKTNLSSEARSPLRWSWPVRAGAKRGIRGIRCHHISGAGQPLISYLLRPTIYGLGS